MDLDLQPHEKEHLVHIAETSIHHSVLDTILSELTGDDKKAFLALVAREEPDHSIIWEFLDMKVFQAEEKIKKTITSLLENFHKDISERKRKK